MNSNYRSILRSTAKHGKSENTSSLVRCLALVGVAIALYVWLTSATLYATAIVAALSSSVTTPNQPMNFADFGVIGATAAMFVMTSAVWHKAPETLKWFWTQIEDFFGRPVVIAQAICHTFIPDNFGFVRKFFGWLGVTGGITLSLRCYRWTFRHSPHVSTDISAITALSHFMTPQMFLFTAGLLFSTTVVALTVRFCFAEKWRVIYAKPKCEEKRDVKMIDGESSRAVTILHASDLHITDSGTTGLIEGGGKISDETIHSVLSAIERDAIDLPTVLLTGDITDNGSASAWERFIDLCPKELGDKIIIIPGNHDLNLQQGGFPSRSERLDAFGRRMRQIRALCVMTELMGERAFLIDRQTNQLIKLVDYFERHRISIEAHISGRIGLWKPMSEIWNGVFPFVANIGDTRVGVVVFDSVKPASVNVTNAIGATPSIAIDLCATLMASTSDKFDCFVTALHHHIAVPSRKPWLSRLKGAFLVFENAAELVEMLAKRGEPTVVFHGHRHVAYVGTVRDSDVAIVASPSATVGESGDLAGGSWRIVKLNAVKGSCTLRQAPVPRCVSSPVKRTF